MILHFSFRVKGFLLCKEIHVHAKGFTTSIIDSIIEDAIINYYCFMNEWIFLSFYISYAALSLRNFIMKFKRPMQASFFSLFIADNYGYCVKKNFHTNLHSTFYMLFYYVVSYDICSSFFTTLHLYDSTYARTLFRRVMEFAQRVIFSLRIYVHAVSTVSTWDDSTYTRVALSSGIKDKGISSWEELGVALSLYHFTLRYFHAKKYLRDSVHGYHFAGSDKNVHKFLAILFLLFFYSWMLSYYAL